MVSHRIRARPPAGPAGVLVQHTDAETIAAYLEDAAHYPGGHAAAVVFPGNEAQIAEVLQRSRHVLAIGAQSSLTGGATPMGEVVVSTAGMRKILAIDSDSVRVQPGVPLSVLEDALRQRGLAYPPVPTYTGAVAGGVVATNAAGAMTFKYGTTRDWVRAMTVVLPSGDVLDIARGVTRASPDGWFEIARSDGATVRIPIPTYRMPEVPKRSAGYFAEPEMDLIDLFIGSEGTLGIFTEVTFAAIARAAAACTLLCPMRSLAEALALADALRRASQTTWASGDTRGIDVAAIEHMDGRCLEIVREDGSDRHNAVRLPVPSTVALLIQLELPAGTTNERAYDELAGFDSIDAPDTPLVRVCRMMADAGLLERTEIALPEDHRRAAQLFGLREAVPAGVNRRIGLAQRTRDPSIHKIAADVIVPFPRLAELIQRCQQTFEERALDYAIWGHLSDGNLHPNVLPRSGTEALSARDAILEIGRAAIRLGGCPLAEHGVGRNPIKQRLLLDLYGDRGIEQMRQVKQALDPEGKLAPGVLFPPTGERAA